MAETCWEVSDADMSNWGWWCRLFATSDGLYFVIDADLEPPPAFVTTVIRRQTAVFYCTAGAGVTDMDADFTYPPGTTPEQAIIRMGYTLTAPPS
jgi:hypothetical protein